VHKNIFQVLTGKTQKNSVELLKHPCMQHKNVCIFILRHLYQSNMDYS